MFKTWELLIEFLQGAQIANNALVTLRHPFARHQYRNAWGIWDEHAGGNSAAKIIQPDMLGFVAYDFLIGFCRGHNWFRIGVYRVVDMRHQLQLIHFFMHYLT